MKNEPTSFPEFQWGRFVVLMADISYHVAVLDDPTIAASKRTFELIDAIPKLAKKHGGKALVRAEGEMIYLWPSQDGVLGRGIGGAMRDMIAAVRRAGVDDTRGTPVYLVAGEGEFIYQLAPDGTFINLLGPGMKHVGSLGQAARSEKMLAMVDRVVAEACPDLSWTAQDDGVFVLE